MISNIALIVINYNQNDYTLHCLDSIAKAEPIDKTTILIDNGSTESAYESLARACSAYDKLHLLRIPHNIGYVRAVNTGLKLAFDSTAQYVVVMNNDTIVDRNAFLELVKTCKSYGDNAIVSGKILHYDDPNRLQYVGTYFKNKRLLSETRYHRDEIDEGQCDDVAERDMIDDIMWMIPRSVYESIGLYDDSFFLYSEQADYALRAVDKGFKLVYTPTAKIWHKGSLTTGDSIRYSPKVLFWRSQGSVIYRYKHMGKSLFVFVLTKLVLKNFAKQMRSVILKRKTDLNCSAVLSGTFSGLGIMLFKRVNNGYNPFQGIKQQ